jgi:hypothetical protein
MENSSLLALNWEPPMTQETKSERRHHVARHVFEALCAKYPKKHIVLMQPGESATWQVADMTESTSTGVGERHS